MRIHSSLHRRGFTLVELLVVIGVIGLLAGLLFPVLARVREGGRAKACISNMKQLSLAFTQYSQDNGRKFPGAAAFQVWGNGGHWVSGTNNSPLALVGSPYTWQNNTADVEKGAIFNYARSANVYQCPSNTDGRNKHLSYSMNCALEFMNDVRVNEPSDIILLIDEEKNNDGYFYAVPANANGNRSTDALTQLHNGGGNLLFVDGHAKFYRMDSYTIASNDDATYSAQSIANKAAGMTKATLPSKGTPHFHDPQFGLKGSYVRVFASGLDTCNVPVP